MRQNASAERPVGAHATRPVRRRCLTSVPLLLTLDVGWTCKQEAVIGHSASGGKEINKASAWECGGRGAGHVEGLTLLDCLACPLLSYNLAVVAALPAAACRSCTASTLIACLSA